MRLKFAAMNLKKLGQVESKTAISALFPAAFRPYLSFMLFGLPGFFPDRPLFDKLIYNYLRNQKRVIESALRINAQNCLAVLYNFYKVKKVIDKFLIKR